MNDTFFEELYEFLYLQVALFVDLHLFNSLGFRDSAAVGLFSNRFVISGNLPPSFAGSGMLI